MTYNTIANWEKGRRNPNSIYLSILASLLGIPFAMLNLPQMLAASSILSLGMSKNLKPDITQDKENHSSQKLKINQNSQNIINEEHADSNDILALKEFEIESLKQEIKILKQRIEMYEAYINKTIND